MDPIEMKRRKPAQAENNLVITALEAGNYDELRLACDMERDNVNACNPLSPLYIAVKKGSLQYVKLLVSKKADVNMSMPTESSELDEVDAMNNIGEKESLTPFLLACRLGHQTIVEYLFHNGADQRKTTSENGLNCLSLAIMYNRKETSKFLVTHTSYDTLLYLMKTVSRDLKMGQQKGRISTLMRDLIQYMPDVAEIVMDRCITLSEEEDKVTCYLELLDDRFSSWSRENTDLSTGKTSDVYDDKGRINVDSIKHQNTRFIHDRNPLDLMRKEDRHAHLLTHPLSIKLIEHKWRTIGMFLNLSSFVIYCAFLALLTGYVLVNPPAFYIKFSNTTTIVWYSMTQDELLPEGTFTDAASYFFGRDGAYLILVFVVMNMCKEMFQIYSQRRKYFRFQSLMEWLIYILTLFLVMPVSGIQYGPYELRETWQWECGALAIFLAWINLALYVRQTMTFGIYVIMFEVVLRSTIKFMLVIFLFMVAFALAFNTLLLNQTDFHSFGDSLLRTFAMSTGELDFTRIFHSQNYLGTENVDPEEDFILTAVFSDVITSLTFVVFVITMPIIAMNLLVGVAVEDIHRIRQKARFYYLKLKVDHIIGAENLVLGTFMRNFLVRRIPITVQFLKMHLSEVPSLRTRLTSIVHCDEVRETVRAVCQRNQEREEIRSQKGSCEQEDPQPDIATSSLLQKLRRMRDEINGLINHIDT